MAKANPVSYGSVPSQANSNGSLNSSVTPEQRAGVSKPLSEGPLRDAETDAYKPAAYEQKIQHPVHGEQTLIRSDN